MTENEALAKMVPPGQVRPGKMGGGGVIQILLTRACTMACYHCTQNSQLAGKPNFMPVEQFEQAVLSLRGYFGLVALFGGQPTLHPQFPAICEVLAKHVPIEKRGLWTNALNGHGAVCRRTFLPHNCNLNVHLDREAYDEFKRDWPECSPVGLTQDSRHSPPFVAMKDVLKRPCLIMTAAGVEKCREDCAWCQGTGQVYDEEQAWSLISACDINQHWSAMIAVFRGKLRAWFCEVAASQAILHQDEPDYPDTGVAIDRDGLTVVPGRGYPLAVRWWELPMVSFREQVRKHCHECGIPLRGYGQLAQADDTHAEQVSETHRNVYRPKRVGRAVELVTVREQLHEGRIDKVTKYLQNAAK